MQALAADLDVLVSKIDTDRLFWITDWGVALGAAHDRMDARKPVRPCETAWSCSRRRDAEQP